METISLAVMVWPICKPVRCENISGRWTNSSVSGFPMVDNPATAITISEKSGMGGSCSTGALTDFVQNWGNANQKILNRAVFSYEDEKTDTNGNVVGFWAGGGSSLPHQLLGFIPFRTSAVIIEPTSCAASVKFHVSIVDICEVTPVSGFSDETINRWTLAGLGTPYDRTEDGAASLTITRTSALPSSCGGTGVAVEVKPSAAQINRDMPIKLDGSQIWPQ